VQEKIALEEKVEAQQIEADKEQFLIAAQQAKMLGELQKIFPIQEINNDVWKIRDLEIQRDFSIMDDEKLSAALAYVAHLVFMIAKFLDVPLRYVGRASEAMRTKRRSEATRHNYRRFAPLLSLSDNNYASSLRMGRSATSIVATPPPPAPRWVAQRAVIVRLANSLKQV